MNDNNTINKVFLVGEISRAPRWHKNGSDGAMLCFALMTKDSYKQNGRLVEQAEEHVVKVPEKRFETELKLRQKVHVEGKLKTSAFNDEQNVRRYKTEVIAIRVTVF